MPNELTQKEKNDILRDVVLVVDPPTNETDEQRDWRKRMEKQVHEADAKGYMTETPFDPE